VDPSFIPALRAIVGAAHVLEDADLRASYETDWTRRYHGVTPFVVRPGSTEEVAAVVGACAAAGVSLVPQGGNTGLVGGGIPRAGEAVLSLTRLNTIGPVDTVGGEVTVGAGATLAQLQQHVRAAGWNFGVDLASRDSCTIGGMIATNAGGIRVIRYGAMRQQFVGIEAVLANGQVIRRLPGLRKDNTGYDLANLLAGSEGTLAIVTAARLRLVPQLPSRAVALLAIPDTAAALRVTASVRGSTVGLEAAELFFSEGVELVCRHAGLPLPPVGASPAYLLLECAAPANAADELAAALANVDVPAAFATEARQRESLWAYRERHTEAIGAEGIPHKLDVALPLDRLAEFEGRVREHLREAVPEARPILFGHVGDGNIHVNILGLDPDDDRGTDAVLRFTAELGGSISAEHGIGVAKARWLHLTRSPADIVAMAAIKSALDPRGILNPGVIFGMPALRE
jgi:FAD/FMN-containing dehydrogenase